MSSTSRPSVSYLPQVNIEQFHVTADDDPSRRAVGLRSTFYAVLGMVLSRSAVLAGWQCRQGVELGLVQGDVGRGGVGGDLHFSFRPDDRRGDRRAG